MVFSMVLQPEFLNAPLSRAAVPGSERRQRPSTQHTPLSRTLPQLATLRYRNHTHLSLAEPPSPKPLLLRGQGARLQTPESSVLAL